MKQYLPIDPSLTLVSGRWYTTKSTGGDSTIYSFTAIDSLNVKGLNYGASRKYWRQYHGNLDNCTEYIDTFAVTIKEIVKHSYPLTLCNNNGSTISFTTSPTPDLNGAPAYSWNTGETSVSIPITSGDPYGKVTKHWVSASSGGCVYVDTILVSVPSKIDNSLVSSSYKVCGDGTNAVTLTATQTGAVTSSKWEHDNGSGMQVFLPSVSALVHQYNPLNKETFSYTSYGDCEQSGVSKSVTVEVNPPFIANLDATSPDFISDYKLPLSGGTVKFEVSTTARSAQDFYYRWGSDANDSTKNVFSESLTEGKTVRVLVVDKDHLCQSLSNGVTILFGSVKLHTLLNPYSTSLNKLNRTFGEYDELGQPLMETFTYGYSTTIFNRYGQQVFTKTNGGWDGSYNGKPADAGVYFYVIEYSTSTNTKKQLKGSIEIVK